MTKRMLIDASHPEETRVAVLDGTRLEAFDIESANRLPLKGNIYLARVVRVEPSLQAAFVEYGGNRHGFLAFGEIHPDYYQIPTADRQRLLEMQRAEAEEDRRREEAEEEGRGPAAEPDAAPEERLVTLEAEAAEATVPHEGLALPEEVPAQDAAPAAEAPAGNAAPDAVPAEAPEPAEAGMTAEPGDAAEAEPAGNGDMDAPEAAAPPPETLGGTTEDDIRERRIPPRFLRHYKIQEVIKRRQIMLIQVVKEERGTKGAALTTYISLAGRFSVLMPNSPRGGGVSRKITSAGDRKRLREAIDELGLPDGMSLIVRTAGAQRPKTEIKRDCEYLLRLWDNIRERVFASTAPALIYEEADLIKRSIRDTYGKDVEEVIIDGEDAYQQAREFMRALMPSHAGKVKPVRDAVPLFARHGVDAQLDALHMPNVQLKSGGYIVINQTEALVAIDVNSGRSTRERHIEDTALRTNLEAADEIARQLRLRDLAGLIVIDFIDMESSKHDGMVERRLKEALKQDRARIQVGRISHFGLLEMSRQRLRPSIAEQAFVTCPHCQGRGLVRSVESSGLSVLRAIEEEAAKRRAAEVVVHVHTQVAFWLLNRKRDRLAMIEERYGMQVLVQPDDSLIPPALRIERTRAQTAPAPAERPSALRMDYAPEPEEPIEAEPVEFEAEAEADADAAEGEAPDGAEAEGGEGADDKRRRRRRRRRRGRRDGTDARPEGAGDDDAEGAEGEAPDAAEAAPEGTPEPAAATEEEEPEAGPEPAAEGADGSRRRRRGRGRRREGAPEAGPAPAPAAEPPPPATPPQRRAPTPADPFAGQMDEIFLAMEAAEEAAAREAAARRAPPAAEPPARRLAEAAPVEPAPVEPALVEAAAPAAEPEPAPPPAPEPEPVTAGAPPAPAASEPPPAAPAIPEAPEPPAPARAEPVVAPPVAPIVLGETPAEDLPRKRGWWRR